MYNPELYPSLDKSWNLEACLSFKGEKSYNVLLQEPVTDVTKPFLCYNVDTEQFMPMNTSYQVDSVISPIESL